MHLRLASSQGTLLLSILDVSQIIGQITMGFLSNRFEPITPMVGSTLYSSAVVLFPWRSSESFAYLLIFCLLYGLFAGGYSVL
jgi:predicted MFS family arabinose efflux permease